MIIGGDLEEVIPSRFTKAFANVWCFLFVHRLVGCHHFHFISHAGAVLLATAWAFGFPPKYARLPVLMSQTGDAAVQPLFSQKCE